MEPNDSNRKYKRTSMDAPRTSKKVSITLPDTETVRRYHVLRSQGMKPNRMVSALINAKYEGWFDQIRSEVEAARKWNEELPRQSVVQQPLGQPELFGKLLDLLDLLDDED